MGTGGVVNKPAWQAFVNHIIYLWGHGKANNDLPKASFHLYTSWGVDDLWTMTYMPQTSWYAGQWGGLILVFARTFYGIGLTIVKIGTDYKVTIKDL